MLRVGTVGTSSIMRTIQGAIRLTDGMECRVVYSRTEEQGRAFAAEMGVPEHCTDYAAMLERSDLDLIDIASPNRFHVEQALAALEHGKHVIVEKPAAVTRGDVQRLIDAARANGVYFFEAITTLFMPQYEACRLLLFCNNCGPAFILGVAGLGCFGSLWAGGLLWAVHMLAALGIALVLPRRPLPPGRDAAGVRPPAFAAAFVRSVRDAAGAMVQICGFVVFFLAALRLTARLTGLSHPVLSGAVELTQGILALPATPTGFVWAAALLGWGGLSVHGQSAAVLSGTDLPLGPYLAAKAAQAALSALLAWPVSRYLWG